MDANKWLQTTMVWKTCLVVSFLVPFFCYVAGQTVPTNISHTEATCGTGGQTCPTDSTLKNSVIPITEAFSTSTTVAYPESTSFPTQEATVTQSVTAVENSTKRPMQVTTTKQMKTPSTTAPTTPETVTNKLSEEQFSSYSHSGTCACDLMAYSCDVNCCCDPECTSYQRASFSSCKTSGYTPYDNRYCFATKLVFLNNSEHVLQQMQNGAFCIVRSNLAGSVLYPPLSVYLAHQDFVKHWDQSHTPNWPELISSAYLAIDKPRPYTAGALLWSLYNSQVQSFDMPTSGLTGACSTLKPVQFLLPWSSKCLLKSPSTQTECEKISLYFHQQLQSIVRSPLFLNQTQLSVGNAEPCALHVCVPMTYYFCESWISHNNFINECKKISSKGLLFGFKSGVCYGVFKRLKLIFYHNGTSGIDRADAYLWLSNITSSDGPGIAVRPMHQSISVEFQWSTNNKTEAESSKNNNTAPYAENATYPFARSGNPGYIVGKPVIAGFRVRQKLGVNVSRDATKEAQYDMIRLSHDPKQWLTLPGYNFQGMCDWSTDKRHVVTFGEDLHMSCGVTISPKNISSLSSCNSLRAKMLQLLLADISMSFQNSSGQSEWGRVVATFGSANTSVPQEWVPLLVDSQSPFSLLQMAVLSVDSKSSSQEDIDRPLETCENVPLGIQIRIMYGLIGTTSNPQSKILGASMRFSPLQDIGKTCSSLTCFQREDVLRLRVLSTVKFVDVTSPAVTRFAEPPAIHIRLPPDFFYPFMATEDSASAPIQNMPLLLILPLSLICHFMHFNLS